MKRTGVRSFFTLALLVGVLVAAVCLGCAAFDCHQHQGGQSARAAALAGFSRLALSPPAVSTALSLLVLIAVVPVPLARGATPIGVAKAVPLRV